MPFNVTLRRALRFADRVELDTFFAKVSLTDGQFVVNSTLGTFSFHPFTPITVDDTGVAIDVPDSESNTHTFRFMRYKRLEAADAPDI